MRPVLEVPAVQFRIHLSPQELSSPVETPPAKKCDNSTCPWWPYSNSKDFKTNAAMIVIVLLFAVICALALNAAIRYLLRRRRLRHRRRSVEIQGEEQAETKATLCSGAAQVAAPPTVVFSAGMKLAGAEAECAICLSEFVDGDGIRVLDKCNHGFHVQCIQKWLISRSSCPTCRAICLLPSSSSSSDSITGCPLGNGANRDSPSAATESRRDPELPSA